MLHVNQQALLEFAEKNVYWCGGERSRVDVSDVLQTILARKPRSVENEARRIFGFTDGDFREALKSTPPGMFLHRERWAEVNRRFHFDPPLPFPRRDIAAQRDMYNENKSMRD